MTNKEAAAMLEGMKKYFLPTSPMLEERIEITALDLAISALSNQCASIGQADDVPDTNVGKTDFKPKTVTNCHDLMDDLISREEAINAVKKNTFRLTFAEEQNCEGHVAWSANAVYSDVMEGALLELPSAQPEKIPYKKPEVICCKDCRYRDPEDKKCDHGHGIVWQLPRPDDWFCADGKA